MSKKEKKNNPEKDCENCEQNDSEKAVNNESAASVPEKDSELSSVKKELEEYKDRFLRLCAEFENYKKRTKAEKESTYSNAIAEFAVTILPVADNLERALAAETDESPLKKGVEMVYQQYGQSLEKLGIVSFGQSGDEFDPNIHEAVMHTEEEGVEPNTITDVLQKGYQINDKVVRPALVKVAN